MAQIAVKDELVEEALRLSEGCPLEQITEQAFINYNALLSLRELRGKVHWDDSGDWSEQDDAAEEPA
jgi:hypothetical protein